MTNYFKLSQNSNRFLSLTCYTVEEFEALLPHFASKLEEYMENFTFEGSRRKKRQYVEYKNASLPTIENKLLFILIYLKGNILQETLAEMFEMQQSKANVWIHLLHRVLNKTLESMDMLPARDAKGLEKKIEKLTEATSEEAELETETLSEEVDAEITSAETTLNEAQLDTETLSEEVNAETTLEEAELETETLSESEEVESDLIEIELYLHDGTERPINRPLNQEIQKLYYSGKKKHHTVKNNLLTNISGDILFLSETHEGKKHDKKVADESGYKLPEGSYLGQDTGFQGFEIPGVNMVQPKKKPRGGELTTDEKERNRVISSVRVRIEHAIGGVKRYKVVKETLRNWKKGFKDKVLETCCGLHNFRLKFRPWHYEIAII